MPSHLLAGNADLEIIEMLNTDLLVLGQLHLVKKVVDTAVTLLNPLRSLRIANAIDLEEFLEHFVVGVKFSVVQPAKTIGPDNLFDLLC